MRTLVLPLIIIIGTSLRLSVESCNEAVCGSIVTKCLLTKSCNCDFQKATCSKNCFKCLGHLYGECCSCIGMCPQKPRKTTSPLSKNSNVGDFIEPVPQLFDVLAEYPDEHNRWDVIVFPIDIDVSQYSTTKEIKLYMKTSEEKVVPFKPDVISINCTVIFWSQCTSWNLCENNCLAMGSSSYRWFHDGCCECIGQHCLNYGINKGSCRLCPLAEGDVEDVEEKENIGEEDYDFGEDEFEDYEEIEKDIEI